MGIKDIKKWAYEFLGEHVWGLGFWPGVLFAAGLAFFIFFNPLPPLHNVLVGTLIILELIWIAVWGWYSVTFRYLFYFMARLIWLIRKFLGNGLVRFLILLFIVVSVQRWRICWITPRWKSFEFFDLREILQFSFLISTLSLTLVVLIFIGLYKARKRIFISDFDNHTGCVDLDTPVKGIAPAIVSEIVRLVNLYKTIDDIHAKAGKDILKATLSVKAIDKDLDDALGGKFEVKVAPGVNINVGALLKLLGRIARGPKLCGCLLREGNQLVLTAWLTGGRMNGNWRIRSEDIDTFSIQSATGKMSGMIEEIAYRMFTHLNKGGSPRWEVVRSYSEGLRKYRETERTEVNRMLLLNEAKADFNKALFMDDRFAECYYNLGIIYNKLENKRSAKAAFRKVLEEKPDDYNSYFELARCFREEKDYANAKWFCEQAINLRPSNPNAWNLLAVILYEKWYKEEKNYKDDLFDNKLDIDDEMIEKMRAAAVISWKELSRALAKGRITKTHKNTAALCIRNLAALKGLKRQPFSWWIFWQAFFLSPDDPDNSDLYFELGKFYYREKRFTKARKAFFKIYEDALDVEDALRFWACYTHANTEQKDLKYLGIIKDGITHFLDITADILQNEETKLDDEVNDHRFRQCVEKLRAAFTLNLIPPEERVRENDLIYISNLRENLKTIECAEDIHEIKELYEINTRETPKEMAWSAIQLNIAVAKQALALEPNNDLSIKLLTTAIEELKPIYWIQIKKLRLHKFLAEAHLLPEFYLNTNNFQEALFNAREAVRLNPFEAEERLLLGRVLRALKDHEKALTELKSSFSLDPGNLDILTELGETYKERGENACEAEVMKKAFVSAVNVFSDALKIMGSTSFEEKRNENHCSFSGAIHNYLGTFQYELLSYDTSAFHFRAASQMGYKPVLSLIKAGWSYINAGSFSQARQALDEAETLNEKSWKEKKEKNIIRLSYSIEIKLGQAAAFAEGAVSLIHDKENREAYAKADERLKEIHEMIKKLEKRLETEPIEESEFKKEIKEFILLAWAMYHEEQGLIHLKEGYCRKALSEFEQAVDYRANARLYLRIAGIHHQCAAQVEDKSKKHAHLSFARNACILCEKHDRRQKYGDDIKQLKTELDELEKNLLKPSGG